MKVSILVALLMVTSMASAQITSSSSASASSGSWVSGSGSTSAGVVSSAWGRNLDGVVTGGHTVNTFSFPGSYATGTATSPVGTITQPYGPTLRLPEARPYVAPTWVQPR